LHLRPKIIGKIYQLLSHFFEKLGADNHYNVDFTDDTSKINNANLANYQVFVMFHLAPFDMSASQQAALQKFAEQGKGWVGIHAAGLTGKEFLGPNPKSSILAMV
jgi:hypothetical protein